MLQKERTLPAYYFSLSAIGIYNQPRMAFSSINKRITDSQHELIKQSILAEYGIYDESYSISESEIIDEFKEWSKQEAKIQKQIKQTQGENNIMENETIEPNQTVTSADNLTAVVRLSAGEKFLSVLVEASGAIQKHFH